jgi:hypothetical protein
MGDWPIQRKHPRVQLLASVELASGKGMVILKVRNISVGGVFVCSDGQDLSSFAIGSRHELTIFTPSDVHKELVVRGRVVRHEPDGMALEWRKDDTASLKLTELIDNAGKK